jgi:hypothetical protein
MTVPLGPPAARRLPSGLKAMPFARPLCPARVRSSWPVWPSQILIVASEELVAKRLLSGLNATLVIAPLCPFSNRSSSPVPEHFVCEWIGNSQMVAREFYL